MVIRRATALVLGAGLAAVCSAEAPDFIGPLDADLFGSDGAVCGVSCSHMFGLREARIAAAERLIEAQTFWSLPEEHRATIAQKLAERGESVPTLELSERATADLAERSEPLSAEEIDEAFARVSDVIDRDSFEGLSPIHQRMLVSFAEVAPTHDVPVMPCFAPGTDDALIKAFEAIVFPAEPELDEDGLAFGRFEQTGRWGNTALNPSGNNSQGTPTILTYSFPIDGINIPNGVGEGAGPNELNAFMDGIYGDRATWRAFYDEIFQRWAELSGNTYILEPNDDNVTLFNSPGVAGVRGDLRMGGKTIDGNSGTLAYNFFPQNGDMVIDTADNFYFGTANRSLRLRNILAHEHGHGMGQLHVCPVSNDWLMEPFINLNFDGPQFDDILNAQRHYGDPNEPNDNVENATPLGTLAGTLSPSDFVTVDDNNDVDIYEIQVTSPVQIVATVDPLGQLYQAGPQTGACNEQQPYDPSVFLNPGVAILDANGATLASANVQPVGFTEEVRANATPGTYYVRVFGTQPTGDQIIAYDLDVTTDTIVPIVTIDEPNFILPGLNTLVSISVDIGGLPVDSVELFFRASGGGSFQSVDAVFAGGNEYIATLPGFLCGEDPEYFAVVTQPGGVETREPAVGVLQATVQDLPNITVQDNAETDIGWTVSGNATEGQWERGFPQGNDRDDPAVDADGSGRAWLTGIEPNDDNSDVDNGRTILTSPVFDFSEPGTFTFSYWFSNTVNPQAGQNLFVEWSTNGSTWNQIRNLNTAADVWRQEVVDVAAEIGLSSTLQFRFIATDEGANQGVIEAGIDAVEVALGGCTNPPVDDCPADVNGDGVLNGADFNAWLAAFNNGDMIADQNNDGQLNGADFNAWLANFSDGCD